MVSVFLYASLLFISRRFFARSTPKCLIPTGASNSERSMPSPLSDADLKQDGSIEPPSTTPRRSYLQNLLGALQLVRSGDFSVRMFPAIVSASKGKSPIRLMKLSQPISKWPRSLSLLVRLSDAKEKQKSKSLWPFPRAHGERWKTRSTLLDRVFHLSPCALGKGHNDSLFLFFLRVRRSDQQAQAPWPFADWLRQFH